MSLELKLKKNTENLAKEKNIYQVRIKNTLAIVFGKNDEFYGFLD